MESAETYKKILLLAEKLSIKWNSLDVNIRILIGLSSIIVVFALIYIFAVHVKFSNTGKLLWVSRSYRYIDIKPKEDYMSIIKPDNSDMVASKVVTIEGQAITISYETEPKAQEIINEIGIHKLIDPIKLAEYATKKVNSILFVKDKIVFKDIKMFFNETNENEHAGAVVRDGNQIIFNWTFIKKMYENMTKDDFLVYYVGLYVHEMVHTFGIAAYNSDRLRENTAEYIRMVAGFQPSTWKVTASNKDLPTEQYGAEGAYFLYWVENKYPGFIKLVSEGEFGPDENKYYRTHTGRSVQDLFHEFKSVLYVL